MENYGDYLTPILSAMATRLLNQNVFTQVETSLVDLPSTQLTADFACNLMPSEGSTIAPQVTGMGRYASGYIDIIKVNVYGRNASDRIYLDTIKLTDATLGLLTKTQTVFDCLQLSLPQDINGNALTQEPIRCLYISEPMLYPKSREWSYLSVVYQVNSSFNINPTPGVTPLGTSNRSFVPIWLFL